MIAEDKQLILDKVRNYNLTEQNKSEGKTCLDSYPYWLTVDPASYCNLRCPFCPTGQRRGTRPSVVLSLDYFKRVLDTLGPYLINVDFCNWGEPQLNDDLYKMIKHAKKYLAYTKVDTNFNIFNEQKAEALVQSGLDKIILSIDGASAETYSKYRKGGDFDTVIDNIKLLVRKKKEASSKSPEIEWQFLIFKHNQHEIEIAKSLASELGVDMIGITAPYVGDPEWLTDLEPYRSTYYDTEKSEGKEKLEFKEKKDRVICNWLWDAVTLNADGSVSSCCSIEEAKDDFSRDFFKEPFMTLWNSENYIRAREHVLGVSGQKDISNVCCRCDHIGLSNHRDIEYLMRELERKVI